MFGTQPLDKYHALYCAYPNGTDCDHCQLFYAVNETGGAWKTFSKPILKPGAAGNWDDYCIYRPSMLLDPDANTVRVWYGAKKTDDLSWHIGYTENDYEVFINALEY